MHLSSSWCSPSASSANTLDDHEDGTRACNAREHAAEGRPRETEVTRDGVEPPSLNFEANGLEYRQLLGIHAPTVSMTALAQSRGL